MSSHDVKIESHVLQCLSQIEEPAKRSSSTCTDTDCPPKPRLKRRLSEPSHKLSTPLKPILKGQKSMTHGLSVSSQSATHHQLRLQPTIKTNIPLSLDSRTWHVGDRSNSQEELNSTVSSESTDELFFTPGSVLSESKPEVQDYLSASVAGNERRTDAFYRVPPTPMPTPTLRSSFSQSRPSQGYPPTRRNTIRQLRRRTPPIVDELDRQKGSAQFPSRQSFTFSAPTPAPSPCAVPLPPSPDDHEVPSAGSDSVPMKVIMIISQRRMSWRPSFLRQSQTKAFPERPEVTRSASKRKSVSDSQVTAKRQKVIHFALPPDHKEHPPMRRRPTPYYEPFSVKLKRLLHSLFAPFNRSEEQKEQRKVTKVVKAAKKARMVREELEYSYRNFDDTID